MKYPFDLAKWPDSSATEDESFNVVLASINEGSVRDLRQLAWLVYEHPDTPLEEQIAVKEMSRQLDALRRAVAQDLLNIERKKIARTCDEYRVASRWLFSGSGGLQ